MNEIITYKLPNSITIGLIILLSCAIGSFILLFIAALMQNQKVAYISYITMLITMPLSIIACFGIGIGAVYMAEKDIQNHKYTIEKTDEQLIINSQSPWLKSMTYEIMTHKNETYYLKNGKELKQIKDSELK